MSIFEQPLEIEIFDANDSIALGQPGRQLVEHIVSQTGDAIMQACHLSARFLPVL